MVETPPVDPTQPQHGILCTVHIYTTLSGLISCRDDGTIYGCNENFILLLLGYSEKEVLHQHITAVLPEIFTDMVGGATRPTLPYMRLLCARFFRVVALR